jgi:hypothetical protein
MATFMDTFAAFQIQQQQQQQQQHPDTMTFQQQSSSSSSQTNTPQAFSTFINTDPLLYASCDLDFGTTAMHTLDLPPSTTTNHLSASPKASSASSPFQQQPLHQQFQQHLHHQHGAIPMTPLSPSFPAGFTLQQPQQHHQLFQFVQPSTNTTNAFQQLSHPSPIMHLSQQQHMQQMLQQQQQQQQVLNRLAADPIQEALLTLQEFQAANITNDHKNNVPSSSSKSVSPLASPHLGMGIGMDTASSSSSASLSSSTASIMSSQQSSPVQISSTNMTSPPVSPAFSVQQQQQQQQQQQLSTAASSVSPQQQSNSQLSINTNATAANTPGMKGGLSMRLSSLPMPLEPLHIVTTPLSTRQRAAETADTLAAIVESAG